MILKMNNKDEKFYQYMGKVFGSRKIQNKTNDRIYDDDDKIWYISLEDDELVAFVSLCNNVIKNVYATNDVALEKLLKKVKKENIVNSSTVTNIYKEIYIKADYKLQETNNYKNFVVISE